MLLWIYFPLILESNKSNRHNIQKKKRDGFRMCIVRALFVIDCVYWQLRNLKLNRNKRRDVGDQHSSFNHSTNTLYLFLHKKQNRHWNYWLIKLNSKQRFRFRWWPFFLFPFILMRIICHRYLKHEQQNISELVQGIL